MGKRGGFFFVVAAAVMTVLVWGNPVEHFKAAFVPEIPPVIVRNSFVATTEVNVDGARLMAHVNAIAQPRRTPAQKEPIRQYIIEQLESYGFSPGEQRYVHPETGAPESGGVNIVAVLPGRDIDAGTLVLGAHYDSIEGSPGADDNGSGIATLLEAARLFSLLTQANLDETTADEVVESPFPRSLKLVFFDQEERQPDGTGLLGSLAFTQEPANIENVDGAIILDMVGYACRSAGCQKYPEGLPLPNLPEAGDFLAVLGLSDHTDLIGAFMGSGQSNWPRVVSLPIPKATLGMFPDLARSDHAPFWEKEIPAVFVTDTANFRNANYHTARDTPETLDVSFFTGSAQHVVNATITMLSQQ